MRTSWLRLLPALLCLNIAVTTHAADSTNAWKNIYRSDWGGTFRYPDGWQIREDASLNTVILTPDDAAADEDEKILVSAQDSGGIEKPDDSRVVEGIEAIVRQYHPLARRVGLTENIKAGVHAAAHFTWDCPVLFGKPSRVEVFTTVLGDHIVSLSITASKEQIVARQDLLRKIFNTFDVSGKAATEVAEARATSSGSKLVGKWMKMDYSAGGGYASTKYTHATLNADGTVFVWVSSESASNFQYNNQQGDNVGSAGTGSQSSNALRGHWHTSGKRLVLNYDNGDTYEYDYEIRPNSSGWPILRLQPDDGKLQEWSKE